MPVVLNQSVSKKSLDAPKEDVAQPEETPDDAMDMEQMMRESEAMEKELVCAQMLLLYMYASVLCV